MIPITGPNVSSIMTSISCVTFTKTLRGDVRRALLGLGEVFGGVDEGFGALGDGSVDLGADSGGRGEGDDWTEVGRRGEGVGEDVLLLKGVGDQLFEAGRERC
jgi:hypothetical protein